MKNFYEILKATQDELKAKLPEILTKNGYTPQVEDGFIYAEGEIPVLLIAHMDTVHKEPVKSICVSDDGILMSPTGIGGDDRCGIFMVLETIKTHKCHVLFTEDEEIGLIGAGKFASSGITPEVNWILEYDRKGNNDAVFYSCDNPEFTEFITDKEIGFVFASGSASDISRVAPAINRAAVNLSCGYYNQHHLNEYVVVSEMMNNIERGKMLIDKPVDKPFEYIEKVYTYKSYKNSDYSFSVYDDYGYGSYYRKPYMSYYNDGYTKNDENSNVSNDETESREDLADIAREAIYDHIDENALRWFSEFYGVDMPRKSSLIVPENILDFNTEEFVIIDGDETIPYNDFYFEQIGDIFIDKDTYVYILKYDDEYGVEVAVKTDKYLARNGGKDILYYPDQMELHYSMTELEFATFCEYTECYLESEIESRVFTEVGIY